MPTREERSAEAAKHVSLMKTIFSAETQASIDAVLIYEDGIGRELELPPARFEVTDISVTTDNAVSALYSAKGSVAILDSAAFTRPGGAYLDGSFGPEQILCAESNLFPILQGLQDAYYAKNKQYQRGMLFTDHAMYLKDVCFSRSGNIKKADIIVVAAPNRTRALQNHRDAAECDADLARRIECIMRMAAVGACDTLVLGAFGCGGFGNDAGQVAGLFGAWLDAHPGHFAHVIFAVPNASYAAFNDRFGRPTEPVVDKTPRLDEEDEDFELPEGVTLR